MGGHFNQFEELLDRHSTLGTTHKGGLGVRGIAGQGLKDISAQRNLRIGQMDELVLIRNQWCHGRDQYVRLMQSARNQNYRVIGLVHVFSNFDTLEKNSS